MLILIQSIFRCYLWAKHCGRNDVLEKTPEQLGTCSKHFESNMFPGLSRLLKKTAVPVVFTKGRCSFLPVRYMLL